ncbi:PDDEXK nuclease domain-containing protein [uncultured Desulfobacter sp.]|uniref:PDDEXK nuclease domain-containing protein n=1 Tax=uncultured Desulfobacter sp. TaxID=240139 RepID=UPI002AA9119E|nr:PDDEXK nuclease domain-containing protein [uncultured Desulfobacter sp.]
MDSNDQQLNFQYLVSTIQAVHQDLASSAGKAVNVSLSLRNWLIGCYISEYQLNGVDRAGYGDQLFAKLAQKLTGISNCNRRQLYRYLKFYRLYPQIVGTLPPQFQNYLPLNLKGQKVGTSPLLTTSAETLLQCLSYSHIDLLVDLDDDTKRIFYEIESVRGGWSVRELRRQISSLYYERAGLSHDKNKLAKIADQFSKKTDCHFSVRDPYVFEFLGLTPAEVMTESHLEAQLIEKIQEFLLELGHGFCFESRQKRILIGGEHFFVDLVFYHRILKCHILVELKLESFNHENIGQLNTYVSWFKKHMITEGDNPPIGILLCTDKNHALAEYALAGMDNHLFVSKYMLQLPKKDEMEKFIEEKIKEIGP